ncbi:hypothetical protein NtRootA4_29010 [Arthrobacter sp. NtRootA4]|nr:hypothetical protein NtRootA4_29010 [Arthrobacter sp. NtRootA4]BCW24255.1 hypothetical protein NtRootC7_31220 [Arthrobacter sp. NtRootC7]BCW28523.1 hypothetical protein NtRootC45_31230 [Arthrobacter sp. NtRootC45]
MMRAARLDQMLPKQGRAAASRAKGYIPETNSSTKISHSHFEGTPQYLPYIDINPHKSGPKWRSYVALSILLVATIAIVTISLTVR